MSQCTICRHEKRDEIEAAILKGDSQRLIATQFSVSQSAISRHKRDGHIQTELVEKPVTIIERVHTVDPWREVEYWHEEIKAIYAQAKAIGEHGIALNAVDKALKSLAAVLQIRRSEMEHEGTVSLDPIAEAREIMNFLIKDYPDVHKKLLEHLRKQYDSSSS